MARRTRTIVHHHGPPPAAPAPAPARPDALSWLLRLAAAVVFVVGVLTTAAPWLHQALRRDEVVPPGWVCRDTTWSTSIGRQRDRRCAPADGWHAERWPDGSTVAVPNRAVIVRD